MSSWFNPKARNVSAPSKVVGSSRVRRSPLGAWPSLAARGAGERGRWASQGSR
jgi:hypothetical protein